MLKKVKENKSQKNKSIKKNSNTGFSFKIKNNKNAPGNIVVTVSQGKVVVNNGTKKELL